MLSHWKMIYGELIHILNQEIVLLKRRETLMMLSYLSNIISHTQLSALCQLSKDNPRRIHKRGKTYFHVKTLLSASL